ncbi:putative NADH-dependent oxidase protein [Oceanicola granulosus HTCC2516]|uniref:Putative NADH-dependent oxidase protein n=1 Tax=Oceanicola granulosus (strain ATCC BAA-861 / DSM 15982 / KCTC 12143 / HTCC2516) TaxID=314256 RepID=Q2CA26_OCEGH|nr:NADH:flavin oxidoreductase [Oceanicola granulosus]EAR49539.1 putative NADH-dependent oxidase protein [Oceanicola granulosus HTCC2516]
MSNDPLLQPYRLKHLTLKNRLMITSHEPAYAEDGMPKERYRAYHVERARAGVALTMTAGSASVSRDSPPAFNNILAWQDEVVGWMKALVDECHDAGCAVMIQLTHLGRRTRWDQGDWLPVLAPGPQREPAHRAFPKVMEGWDIARIISDYADAAERMQAAGLDGIELEAYGHLMDQFWSPGLNALEGRYGAASLDDRLRFATDTLAAIRARVGPDFIVGMRFAADEARPGGVSKAEGLEIAAALKATGMVDFFNIIRGHIETDAALTDVIPVQGMASAPHLDFAGEVRAGTAFPTFHAAKIQDVATARHAIASGKLDMVGMTRAHMADPHIVAKVMRGEEARIRPCVGANYCLDRIYQGGMALCLHNPATGRELEQPHAVTRAAARRRVVVVGAGPAGLEAARVAAERGHEVIVHEAADRPGGQVRLTAQTPRRAEMIQLIQWRVEECERLGVSFRYNSFADAADVRADAPDVVIVATGGLPDTEVLAEGDELVVSAWDILSGDARPGSDVLIYDDAGDYPALQAAESLAAAGSRVELVTRERGLSSEVMAMSLTPAMRVLQQHDVTVTVTWKLDAVRREGNGLRAILGSDYGDATRERLVDQVVVNHGTRPLDEVYFELRDGSVNLGEIDHAALIAGEPQDVRTNPDGAYQLFRIGDAVAARNTHAAIYDALRLCKAL